MNNLLGLWEVDNFSLGSSQLPQQEEYSPAREYIELMTRQGIAAVNTETGDIISAFDPDISCEDKAEAVAFLLDTLSLQEQAYKDRENKLKEKRERLVLLQDRIKETFKQQMLNEGLTKIKTLETTWYFMNKPKLMYNLEAIPTKYCEVELKGKVDGLTGEQLAAINPSLQVIKKKPMEFYHDELKEHGLLSEFTNTVLCKR